MLPVKVESHGDWLVVRDDLLDGGTKRRAMEAVVAAGATELVYAGPSWGGAAVAASYTAAAHGIGCTLFYAARKQPTARMRLATQNGADVVQVRAGYLTVLKARAREHVARTGGTLVQWGGGDAASATILEAALVVRRQHPDVREVWCAAGSGTLALALAEAFPQARVHAVQVGAELPPGPYAIHRHPLSFMQQTSCHTPFPSCRHYDAKAWEMAQLFNGGGRRLFWNVMRHHAEAG